MQLEDDTVEAVKNLMSGKVFIAPLVTPITESLMPSQVAEFLKLQTYKPTTNISNDGNAGMEVSYVCDTKAYIDRKFDELATALVASK